MSTGRQDPIRLQQLLENWPAAAILRVIDDVFAEGGMPSRRATESDAGGTTTRGFNASLDPRSQPNGRRSWRSWPPCSIKRAGGRRRHGERLGRRILGAMVRSVLGDGNVHSRVVAIAPHACLVAARHRAKGSSSPITAHNVGSARQSAATPPSLPTPPSMTASGQPPANLTKAGCGADVIRCAASDRSTVVQGLAELRRPYGTGDGCTSTGRRLSRSHARLAVGIPAGLATCRIGTNRASPVPPAAASR